MLITARGITFTFILLTILVAFQAETFGGVIGLIVTWFAALLGPISIPMILGLLPIFKHSDSKAALFSIFGGLIAFAYIKLFMETTLVVELSTPLLTSLVISVGYALVFMKPVSEKVESLLSSLNNDK